MPIGQGFRFEQDEINYRDVGMLGDCDGQCAMLAEKLGWEQDLAALMAGTNEPSECESEFKRSESEDRTGSSHDESEGKEVVPDVKPSL